MPNTTTAKNLYLLMARQVSVGSGGMVSIHEIVDKFISTVDKASVHEQGLKPGEATVILNIDYFIAISWLFSKKLTVDTPLIFTITIIDPNGKRLGGPEQEQRVPSGSNKLNLNLEHKGLPATTSGTYILRAELLTKQHKLIAEAEYPFEVDLDWQ